MAGFAWGCSATRNTAPETTELRLGAEKTLRQTEVRNITNSGFFIQKGRISTSGDAGRINLLFTMKYAKPGIYLISLRSITGAEAFRVYITPDTVLINDRLNQQLLYGNPFDFERIAGIHPDLLRISLGDIATNSTGIISGNECQGNRLQIESYYKGLLIRSVIDCRIEKVISAILNTGNPDGGINITYEKHRYDFYRIPRKIDINDYLRNVKITVRIDKYLSPWIGDVEFIPGNGYSIKSLI